MASFLETARSIGLAIAEIILIVLFCIKYIKEKADKADIPTEVKDQSGIDILITEKMEYYKEVFHADRVLLFEFHDGQHYSDYRHALKMSASYEVFRAGLSSIRTDCSNLPIAIMPGLIYDITHKGKTFCGDIEELKDKSGMGGTYEFKKDLGMKSYYDHALCNSNGDIVGFVAIEWGIPMASEPDEQEVSKLVWFLEDQLAQLKTGSTEKKSKKKGE